MHFDPEALPVPDLGLRCLECQYQLVGLMSHRCPECGRVFALDEHIPPGDWPALAVYGKGVPATPETLALLKAEKIPIFPFSSANNAPHGMSREYGGTTGIRVARIAYWDAVDLFCRWARGEPLEPPDTQDAADWTCTKCNESNPGNFEVCWQCNDARPT